MSHPKEVSHQLIIGGGGQQVTGSLYAIERTEQRNGKKTRDFLILDCGLFQETGVEIEENNTDETKNIKRLVDTENGKNKKESSKDWIFRKNFLEIPIDVDPQKGTIRQVEIVITHAHFDHCARLIILVKVLNVLYPGIRIRIICTEETKKLLPIALKDYYGIQEKVILAYIKKMNKKISSLLLHHNNNKKGRKNKPTKEKKKTTQRQDAKGRKQSPLSGPFFYTPEDIEHIFQQPVPEEKLPYRSLDEMHSTIQTLYNMDYYDRNTYVSVLKNVYRSIEYFQKVQSDSGKEILSDAKLQELQGKLRQCIESLQQEKFADIPYKELKELTSRIAHIRETRHQPKSTPFSVRFETPAYHEIVSVMHHARLQLLNAGHILGSASVLVTFPTKYGNRTILYTGDLGSRKSETRIDLVGEPESIQVLRKKPGDFSTASGVPNVDLLISESTYGGRKRERQTEEIRKMFEAIQYTLNQDGNVIVPSFALQRSQDFLFKIYEMVVSMNNQRDNVLQQLGKIVDYLEMIGEDSVFQRNDLHDIVQQLQNLKSKFPKYQEEITNVILLIQGISTEKRKTKHTVSVIKDKLQHIQQSMIPIRIYMDSHLGIAFNKVFQDTLWKKYEQKLSQETIGRDNILEHIAQFHKIFMYEHFVEKPVPSMRGVKGKKNGQDIRQEHFDHIHGQRPCIIVSSSGMGDHGPARTHIEIGLQDKRNLILLIGYMAKGTLGRMLLESRGKKEIMIGGKRYSLNARIHHLEAFSSHADQADLLQYVRETLRWSTGKRKIIQVHGEPEHMESLARQITGGKNRILGIQPQNILRPKTGDVLDLDELLK
jgi:Cft2 family RNA processing exonuclease